MHKPSDDILNAIKRHFACEWHVKVESITIDSIETRYHDEVKYYLEFSIDWDGSFDNYWCEITHAEVVEEMRERKLTRLFNKINENT